MEGDGYTVSLMSVTERVAVLCVLFPDELKSSSPAQTIALLLYSRGARASEGPFLILCPLSVMENWREEMER